MQTLTLGILSAFCSQHVPTRVHLKKVPPVLFCQSKEVWKKRPGNNWPAVHDINKTTKCTSGGRGTFISSGLHFTTLTWQRMKLRYSPVWTASRPCSSSWSRLFCCRTELSRQSLLLISSISARWGEMHTSACDLQSCSSSLFLQIKGEFVHLCAASPPSCPVPGFHSASCCSRSAPPRRPRGWSHGWTLRSPPGTRPPLFWSPSLSWPGIKEEDHGEKSLGSPSHCRRQRFEAATQPLKVETLLLLKQNTWHNVYAKLSECSFWIISFSFLTNCSPRILWHCVTWGPHIVDLLVSIVAFDWWHIPTNLTGSGLSTFSHGQQTDSLFILLAACFSS